MRAFVTLYSKAFLETDDDSWSARPSSSLLQRLHNGEGSARWIACISPPVAIGSESYISIGDPVPSDRDRKILYLPQWFMESVGVEDGFEMDLDFKRSEEMPRATSLTFRMLGPLSDLDIRDLLEEPLSQLGVLQVGQIIPLPVLEGVLILESCEPDGIVFLDGAEIALDIVGDEPSLASEKAFVPEAVTESPFAQNTAVAEAPINEPFEDMPMIPSVTTKFVPFQGLGNRLGD